MSAFIECGWLCGCVYVHVGVLVMCVMWSEKKECNSLKRVGHGSGSLTLNGSVQE